MFLSSPGLLQLGAFNPLHIIHIMLTLFCLPFSRFSSQSVVLFGQLYWFFCCMGFSIFLLELLSIRFVTQDWYWPHKAEWWILLRMLLVKYYTIEIVSVCSKPTFVLYLTTLFLPRGSGVLLSAKRTLPHANCQWALSFPPQDTYSKNETVGTIKMVIGIFSNCNISLRCGLSS